MIITNYTLTQGMDQIQKLDRDAEAHGVPDDSDETDELLELEELGEIEE